MELLGIEMSLEEFDRLLCEQSQGKQLKVIDGKVVAKYRVITQEEINQNKLKELDNWFKNNYTMYEQMLIRRKTLGIEDEIFDEFRNKTYKSVLQLYNEAEVVASEIRALKEKLKTEE